MGSDFNDKLKKYLRGELSPADKAKMDDWLDSLATSEDEDHVKWSKDKQDALLERIRTKTNNPGKHETRKYPARFWAQVAAAVAVLAIASFLIVPRVMTPVISITEARDELRKMSLPDGTLVWLKGQSMLTYSGDVPNERHAILKGEALFEVAKDPSRPFIIACGDVSVRVVGTSFTLKSSPDSVQLLVLTGKVRMFTADDTTGILVLPDQQVTYTSVGSFTRQIGTPAVPEYVQASEYNMRFNDASLAQILNRIEKKFNTTVVLNNPEIGKCKVTADFTDLSLEKTLEMIAAVHGIIYTVEGTTVTISGKGCP